MKTGPYLIWGLLGAAAIVVVAMFLSQRSPITVEALADGTGFKTTAILSGRQHHDVLESFVGGEASAFMGGVQLDLRNSTMSESSAVIEVFVMMGGIDVRVPADWLVVNNVDAVMGGVDDKTRPTGGENAKRLVLQGTVLMGGLNIRN
jgi:hypothetical protein